MDFFDLCGFQTFCWGIVLFSKIFQNLLWVMDVTHYLVMRKKYFLCLFIVRRIFAANWECIRVFAYITLHFKPLRNASSLFTLHCTGLYAPCGSKLFPECGFIHKILLWIDIIKDNIFLSRYIRANVQF